MATRHDWADGFGRVSRRADVVFRYLLLAATLLGIVMLGILLVYVANDAIQPLTASPGWQLTVLLLAIAPPVGVAGWLWHARGTAVLDAGVKALGLGTVGLLFGSGLALVFVDLVDPVVWLSIVVAVGLPFPVAVALQRVDRRVPYLARVAVTAAALVVSIALVPPEIQSLRIVPTDSSIILATLTLPLAAVVGSRAAARLESRRMGLAAGAVAIAVPTIAMVGGPTIGLDPLPAVLLATVAAVPTLAYVGHVLDARHEDRLGLLLPAVTLAGVLLAWAVVETAGFAGPDTWVDWQFLTNSHSRTASQAGFYPAIGGSIILMTIVALLSFPLGVGSAVYLEEYAPENRFTRVIDVNISNLAGVPSVVYGLLGLGLFVTYLGRPPGTALVGGATLALLILPIVIIASREAIRSVPDSLRAASDGLGATRWQTVRNVVLPRAFPGILTGTILALGRAIGETAPLIMIGAANVTFSLPGALDEKVGAMPLQIFAWASLYASDDFYTKVVPAGVVVLLVVLLAMNSVAIALRNTYQNRG